MSLFIHWDKIVAISQTTVFRSINQQYSSIGSDNGLALNRRQAIIWTNDGYFTDAYMRHPASFNPLFPGRK